MADFEAAVRRPGPAAVIDMTGEIDGRADAVMGAAFDKASNGDPARVVLNFGEVSYINSTGIAVIVGILARARAAGTPLAAFGLSEHYREIFEITRLAEFVSIHADEASAMGGSG